MPPVSSMSLHQRRLGGVSRVSSSSFLALPPVYATPRTHAQSSFPVQGREQTASETFRSGRVIVCRFRAVLDDLVQSARHETPVVRTDRDGARRVFRVDEVEGCCGCGCGGHHGSRGHVCV